MSEVCKRCTMLATKVSSPREAIKSLSAQSSTATRVGSEPICEPTYPGAVQSRGPQCRSPLPGQGVSPNITSSRPFLTAIEWKNRMQYRGVVIPDQANTIAFREEVKVDGARRIWNTIPTCTARAIAATFSKLAASTKLELCLKLKTKKLSNNILVVVCGAWQWEWSSYPREILEWNPKPNSLAAPKLLHVSTECQIWWPRFWLQRLKCL